MTSPLPRALADDDDKADREYFLAACAHMWDHARKGSRCQMTHGATMILAKLGGLLILRAESTVTKRTVPEAGFLSEGFTLADFGHRGII